MSRLVIKNLPEGVTEDKIKSIFGEQGTITDIQLKYTKEGKFRRFGFVGYKSEEEAAAAHKALQKIFINNNRISVELCANLGDPSKPKSWSKYAPDSTKGLQDAKNKIKKNTPSVKKENETKQTNEIKEIIQKHKNDPLFKEYLEGHLKGDKQNNELLQKLNSEGTDEESDSKDDENENSDAHQDADDVQKEDDLATKAISDKDYMELLKKKAKGETVVVKENVQKKHKKEFFTVKLKGLAYNHKKKDIKNFFKGIPVKSIRVPQKIKGIAYAGFKTERLMKNALNKNRSFLDGKQITVTVYTKKNEEDKSEDQKSNPRWKKQEDTLKDEESIGESGRIFLRNLSYTTTEDEIRQIFEKYGQLTEVNLPVDTTTRKIKGFGTVTFLLPEHAVKAFSELDGTVHCGRLLHLLPAKSATTVLDLLDQDGLTFKQKKELQQKAQANSSHNWNTLFLGQNAVADAVAKAYGTTKEKVLDDNSGTSMAVRLALGETQLVQETQKFLEQNGVKLTAFNQAPKERSTTVILVKNLPAGTQVQEIERLFAQYGELGRVILPPSGITALVEFFEPYEARKAFKKLAYSKFKHMPLYLEWAPNESFVDNTPRKMENNVKINEAEKKKEAEKMVAEKEESEEEDDEEDNQQPEPDTTLFVKNLNFNTTDESLKKHFIKCGKIDYATVSEKKDPNDPANKLSLGYGFVRYKLKSDADRALKELQFSLLDGKTLELKLSERTLSSEAKPVIKKTTKVTEQTGTKIMVKNLPFQANADEVKDLFKVFGELKAVRLPKKLATDTRHRGFGFVEFYTKKEAKRAFKALCQSTHLYGRRLVLEWAQTEENVEDLRKRTAKHFHEEDPSAKRSKKSTLNPEDMGLAE
ncbi:probable RNA-binding protein 19 [Trichogramma pretiosum]|uniref:probable RNA-binding protein 19 n=1 Tax=Trichogramma pretiosum TaxID=7493 RepID=UPI0006C950D4|nr:probable RNA-binding protein 19 [Trichogramma pretiosum]